MPASADNIATFVEVVRGQSLSAAARQLGLPKSTVSRRLARLEQELDTQLLLRDARKITLTSAGRSFYASVVQAVDGLASAVAELARSSQAPSGAIRLTAPADLGRMVLAPIIVAFLERYPDITLELLFTNRLVDLVQEGVDLAVRAGRVAKGAGGAAGTLIARKLCDSELQLAASATRAVSRTQGAELRSLESQPFVLYGASARSQSLRLEREGAKPRQSVELNVSGRLHVDDYAALAELVAAGQGVGLLPSLHVQEGVAAGKLVRLFPDWSSRTGHVYLVYPSRQLPERVRLLSDFLVAAFSHLHSV